MEMCWQPVLLGFVGGCAVEALEWFRIRKELYKGVPDWSKNFLYWVVTLVMAGLGGLLVFIYQASGVEVSPIVAFNIGASAPLILQSLIAQVPEIDRGNVK